MQEAVMQIVQTAQQDPQAAAQMALEFVMMLAQQMGMGAEAAPAQPEEAPVFAKGGRLVRVAKKGAKMMKSIEVKMELDPKKAKMMKGSKMGKGMSGMKYSK